MFPAQVSAEQLFDAIEGVAYLTDLHGIILAVGNRGWTRFATDNGAPWMTPSSVIGTSLFASLSGATVVSAYRRMHAAVADGRRAETVFEFRCDSPIAERHMRMSIMAVLEHAEPIAVLYQSQILSAVERPALQLFSAGRRPNHADQAEDRISVRLCAFCQRVAWPTGKEGRASRWISAREYERLGGSSDVRLIESVCRECTELVVAPHV